jgi:hypothetical protein
MDYKDKILNILYLIPGSLKVDNQDDQTRIYYYK